MLEEADTPTSSWATARSRHRGAGNHHSFTPHDPTISKHTFKLIECFQFTL